MKIKMIIRKNIEIAKGLGLKVIEEKSKWMEIGTTYSNWMTSGDVGARGPT